MGAWVYTTSIGSWSLPNWATLLDVSPRELSDWFWVAFTDAYDWVVEPNVIGMGTFGVIELMTTKPYVSGSAYINKMNDYCSDCQFSPGKTCPMTSLYWAFLDRHGDRLSGNPRLSLVLGSSRNERAQKNVRMLELPVGHGTLNVENAGLIECMKLSSRHELDSCGLVQKRLADCRQRH